MTLRLMASGDHHFEEGARFEECLRVHTWIAEEVERQRPDVFLSGGDIYERASTPRERAEVALWLRRIAEVCPVVIAKGNHDRPMDCWLLSQLRTGHRVIVEEACGVHEVGGFAIAAVAWPNKSNLAAMLERPVAIEQLDDTAREAMRDVLRGLGLELDQCKGPRILLGHFQVDGSRVSTGQPLIGAELRMGLEDFSLARPHMTICGHIHMPQEWEFGGMPIVYTGSPYRTAFGEVEQKSILLAEFDEGGLVRWERIPTPAQAMVLLEGEWDGEAFTGGDALAEAEKEGAAVRFRYQVADDQRDAARSAAADIRRDLLELGAATVKVEEVVRTTTRARAPEIATAASLDEKLTAYWKLRGLDIPPERQTRLLGRVHELQESTQ